MAVAPIPPPLVPPPQAFDILVVEDDAIVAHDLAGMLEEAGYGVIGPVDSCAAAMSAAAASRPHLVLMDIHLPGPHDGLDAARMLWREWMLPCVFVTAADSAQHVRRAAHPGVVGYVLKPFEQRQLLTTIALACLQASSERDRWCDMQRQVVLAEAYARIADEVEATRRALDRLAGEANVVALPEAVAAMSPRERQVLRMLLSNHRVPMIAQLLFISPHTVRNHLKSIFRKAGVGSQTELIERLRKGPRSVP